MDLAPQLAFNGNCRQAFEYYSKLLGGEVTFMNTFGGNEAHALPPGSVAGEADKIRFAEVRFGEHALRGNDVGDDEFAPMRGFSISLHVAGTDEAKRIFEGLADGGEITTPLSQVDWAKLFGMVTDRFGVPWLILAVG